MLLGLAVLLTATLGSQVQGARYLIDFGPNDGNNGTNTLGADYFGHYWNNLNDTAVGGTISSLVNTTNGASGIALTVTAVFSKNGILNGGLLGPDQNLLGDLAVTNATEDYFYTGGTGSFSITNLNANRLYDFKFFGSRLATSGADTRITRYSVVGGNGTLNTNLTTTGNAIGANGYNGNNNSTVGMTGVAPDGSGAIQVSVICSNTLGYINLMEMVERVKSVITNVTASSTIPYGTGSITLTGVVATVLSQYPPDSETVAVTINGVTSNAVISGGTGAFSVTFPTATMAPGTYTITYVYGGNSNLAVAINTSASLTIGKVTPVVSQVTASQTIVAGTVSLTLTGVVSGAGVLYPTNNETVAVTINGLTSNAVVAGGAGGFSVTFPTTALQLGSYAITYAYGGDAGLNAASNTATSLMVTNGGALGPIQFLPVTGSVTNNLTAIGVTDWKFWYKGGFGGGPVFSSEKKSGGSGIRTNLTITGATQAAASSSALAFSWTDGTPDASVAATNSMIYMRNGGASAASFVVDVTSGSVGEIHFWYTAQLLVGSRGTATVTAAYSDGTAATQVVYIVGTTNEECVIPFKPNGATPLLVTLTNDGEAALSFAAVAVGKATPAIINLVAVPSVSFQAASVTLTGTVVAVGSAYPADGERVAVTINGVTSNAVVMGGAGGFSVNFPTASLTPGSRTITYAYSGNASLNIATNSSTSLTIGKATPTVNQVPTSQTIVAGTVSVTLTGVVSAAGPLYPANGETVAVTINGVTSNAAVAGGAGGFSVNFPMASLPLGSYPITYAYGGNASLNPANNTAASLMVTNGGAVGPIQFLPVTSPRTNNLTAIGTMDWKYWYMGASGGGTAVSSEKKASGTGIHSNLTISGATAPATASSIYAFGWSDGTPDANITVTNSMINMNWGGSSAASFAVDVSSGTVGEIHFWYSFTPQVAGRTATVTAAYTDGTGATQTLAVALGQSTNGECVIPFKPNGAATLSVCLTNSGQSVLNFAAVAVGNATPAITPLVVAPSVSYGAQTVTLTGVVSAVGATYPAAGENVAVTINGVTSNAVISGGSGAFSLNFPTAALALGSYAITYVYGGNASLNAATNNSTSLTVTKAAPVIFNVLATPSLVAGTASITLSGRVSAAGPVYPSDGEYVTVTVNGVSTNAVISGGLGGFSVAVRVSALTVPGAPYVITYAYGGDGYLNAAAESSTTALTVTKATPVIGNVMASQTIVFGTSSVTLTGVVSAAGPVYPADGELVAVTINGVSSNAVIAGGVGVFSVMMPVPGLTVSGSPYTIAYAYAGNANLNAAGNSATALTVTKVSLLQLNPALAVASSGTAAAAFDGNSHTRWASSSSDNQWIYIDLGADYTLDSITLDWETANSQDYTLRMRTSAQGVDSPVSPADWTQIAAVTGRSGITDGVGGVLEDRFTFTNGTFTALVGTATGATVSTNPKGRYLMIYGTTRATGYGHSLWEVKVYGQGVGGTVGVQFQSSSNAVNLTAKGVTDWRYWCGGSGGARTLSSVERKVGGLAIRDGLVVSPSQNVKTGPISFNWTNGTPDIVATTNDMLNLRQGGPSQAGFTVDLIKGYEGEIRLWFGCLALTTSRTVTVTATYPDGTTASHSLVVALNDTQYRECVIPFTPDGATTLAVTITSSGESELYVGAAAITSTEIPPAGSVYSIR